jgi:O-antigen ligase
VVATPMLMYFILKTGSRANFLTLIVVGITIFLMTTRQIRIAMLLLIPFATAISVIALPHQMLQRLTLILVNPEEQFRERPEFRGAIGSQIARTELQERAIRLTLRRPLLGVGAEMFPNAVDEMVRAETGRKSGWQVAHNTYLEIAAENGIPAFLLFITCIFLCLRMNYRSYRTCKQVPEMKAALGHSSVLLLITVVAAFGIFFNNSMYDPQLDMLVGITTANYLAVARETRAVRRA